jgi:hypothetical protein
MRAEDSLLYGGLILAVGVLALGLAGGCGSVQRSPETTQAVLFPPPPERPRLQFLKSFSGPADLGVPGTGAFERLVLGDAPQRQGIGTPYGVAIFDGKIYACDVATRRINVLDLRGRSFGYLTEDRRLMNPVNIVIEPDGTKYVADPSAGAVFVFDAHDTLHAILGKELEISPIDIAVRGPHCYVTDYRSNQVVVLDKRTGKEVRRIGEAGAGDRQFRMISDLTFGPQGELFVTDRLAGRIFHFDPSGALKRTIGTLGDYIDELARPKGIALDRANRIWVVDSMPEVAKIYDSEGRLLLFFGLPGNDPGMMNMPAKIIVDYDHVDLFRQYAVKGADIEFLVLVTNQYGPHKVSVYGFGSFPFQAAPRAAVQPPTPAEGPPLATAPSVAPQDEAAERLRRTQAIADLYYRSMALYRAGQLEQAREGFIEVIESRLIPPAMEETLRGYLREINAQLRQRPAVSPQGPTR